MPFLGWCYHNLAREVGTRDSVATVPTSCTPASLKQRQHPFVCLLRIASIHTDVSPRHSNPPSRLVFPFLTLGHNYRGCQTSSCAARAESPAPHGLLTLSPSARSCRSPDVAMAAAAAAAPEGEHVYATVRRRQLKLSHGAIHHSEGDSIQLTLPT